MPHKRELTQDELNEIRTKAQKNAERNQKIKVSFFSWREDLHQKISDNSSNYGYSCDPLIIELESKLLEADYAYNNSTIQDVTVHIGGILNTIDKYLVEKKDTQFTGEKDVYQFVGKFKQYLQDKVIGIFYSMNEMTPEEKSLPMTKFQDITAASIESQLKKEKYAEIDGVELPQKEKKNEELPPEEDDLFDEGETITTEKAVNIITKKYKEFETQAEKFIYVSNVLAAIKNKKFLNGGIDDFEIEEAVKELLLKDEDNVAKKVFNEVVNENKANNPQANNPQENIPQVVDPQADNPQENNQQEQQPGNNPDDEKKNNDPMHNIMRVVKDYAIFMAETMIELSEEAKTKGPEVWYSPKAYAVGGLQSFMFEWGTSINDMLPEGSTLMSICEEQKMNYLKHNPEKLEKYEKNLWNGIVNEAHPEIRDYKGIDDIRSEFAKENPEKAAYYQRRGYKEIYASLPTGIFNNKNYVEKISRMKDVLLGAIDNPFYHGKKIATKITEIANSLDFVVNFGNKMQKSKEFDLNTNLDKRDMFQNSADSVAKSLGVFMQKMAANPVWYDENHRDLRDKCSKLLGLLSNSEYKKYKECEKSMKINSEDIERKAESNRKLIRNYINYRQNGTFRIYNSSSTLRKMMQANDPQDPKKSCNRIAKLINDDFQLGTAFSLELAKQCVKTFNDGYERSPQSTTRGFLRQMAQKIPANDIADFDIDIHAKSDDTKNYRGFENFDVKITYKPMLSMRILNSVESVLKDDFSQIKNLLTNKEDMDLYREMFNTKKSALIINTGRYNNTKNALDDFFNKRDRLMRSLDEYQRRGIERSEVDVEKIRRQSNALLESAKTLLPLLANYSRNSEKKSLSSYGQEAGVARIVGVKGLLSCFRSKSKELTNEYAPEELCKNTEVSEKDRSGLELEMARFTEAFREAFSAKREIAAYDRHRRATTTAIKKM